MLLSLAYLPAVSWCSAFWNAPEVVIEACEHYQKGSLRNRAYLAGPNGIQRLSIPLEKGKHQQTPIRDVRISYDEPWQRQHWRTIKTAYGNAPYFEHYAGELMPFYENRVEHLFDFNFRLMTFVLVEKLGWRGEIRLSEQFGASTDPEQNRNLLLQNNRHNLALGNPENPIPSTQDLIVYPTGAAETNLPYPQVFQEKHGFLPNLSVLDLLFCCGKRSTEILARSQLKDA